MALTKVPSNLDATVAITQSASDNSTNIATTAYVTTAIANLVDGAPSTLNTLDEIAAALNDDAALNTTLTNSIATKLPLAGGTMTGNLTLQTAANPTFTVLETGAGGVTVQGTGSGGRVYSNSSQPLLLGGGGQNNHVYISSIGRVSIGDSSTSANNLRLVNASSAELDLVCSNGKNFRLQSTNASAFAIVDKATNETRFHIGTSGNVGVGTGSPQDRLHIAHDSSATNSEVDVVRVEATSSGTPVDGFGPFIDFRGDRQAGSPDSYGRIGFESDGMTPTTVDGAFIVQTAEDGTYSERMRINSNGNVIVNSGTFPSLPTGSTLNVFGNGETLRLDGTGNTSRTLRFRGVSTSNPGIITADGSLKIQTEDANTAININSIRDINYRTTDTNSTAGHHTFYSYNTQIMKINGSNNFVKIGTGDPASPLHVSSNATDHVVLINRPDDVANRAEPYCELVIQNQEGSSGHNYGGALIMADAQAHLRFQVGNSDSWNGSGAVRWQLRAGMANASDEFSLYQWSSGQDVQRWKYANSGAVTHIGAGTSEARIYLGSAGGAYNNNSSNWMRASGGNVMFNAASGQHKFEIAGSQKGYINASGFQDGSDIKLKENIQDISYGLDTVLSLKPRKFDWKDAPEEEKASIGFIAQEVEEIIPEIISESVSPDGDEYTIKGMNYGALTAALVKAIQEQQTIIDDLKSRIETLEG